MSEVVTQPPSHSYATSTSSDDKAVKVELELPPKQGNSSLARWLHHVAFTYYRKTFTVIFVANLVAFIVIITTNNGHPLAPNVGSAASVNLMIALLFRQENFVNLCYEIALACPHRAPVWLRRRLAKVFHYGGTARTDNYVNKLLHPKKEIRKHDRAHLATKLAARPRSQATR
ncbi:hypothetical protein R3P38DRAFT_2789140 [Favolaschia claudopus]|uniref:Uncharacterized protein n=1 Tax=Favolaschia claudopus TaxID=2862362 RepID=A0AAW0AJ03_9AGAR